MKNNRVNILAVDDEDFIIELFKLFFSRMGMEGDACSTPCEALDMFSRAMEKKEPYDLVFADTNIRGSKGGAFEILALLSSRDPGVKIIVMSGDSNHRILENPQQYGFAGAFSKPVILQSIEEKIKDVLGMGIK